MSHDRQRKISALERQNQRLKQENQDLRSIIGDIDPGYASAYRDLCDLAIHGLTRPDDLGGPITLNSAKSCPPRYHPAAYHYRNEERRDQRHRAQRLRGLVEALTDDQQLAIQLATLS